MGGAEVKLEVALATTATTVLLMLLASAAAVFGKLPTGA